MEIRELAEQLVNLTVLETKQLGEILKEDYGIEPTSPEVIVDVAVEKEVEVEQTEFDVWLDSFGTVKLKVVKELKERTGRGLKEAKELVDTAPCCVAEKYTKSDAETLKDQLEAIGATISIK